MVYPAVVVGIEDAVRDVVWVRAGCGIELVCVCNRVDDYEVVEVIFVGIIDYVQAVIGLVGGVVDEIVPARGAGVAAGRIKIERSSIGSGPDVVIGEVVVLHPVAVEVGRIKAHPSPVELVSVDAALEEAEQLEVAPSAHGGAGEVVAGYGCVPEGCGVQAVGAPGSGVGYRVVLEYGIIIVIV